MSRLLPLASALAALVSSAPAQTTWYVDVANTPPGSGTQGDPFASLQAALAQAATLSGDTVVVAPGIYAETIDFLGKALDVQAVGGSGVTVLDGGPGGGPNGSVVTLASGEGPGTRLAGFTLRNGTGTDVASVRQGGGLYVSGATVVLDDLVVVSNRAGFGAGAFFESSVVTISESTFADNTLDLVDPCGNAVAEGGGICLASGSTFVFTNVDVLRNEGSAPRGGGLSVRDSVGTWTGGLIQRNRSESFGCPGFGGGLFSDNSTLELDGVTFDENVAVGTGARGGAILATSGALTVRNAFFVGNRSGEDLGAILDLVGWGGAIRSEPAVTLVVRDSTFSDNLAFLGGGAIDAIGADVADSLFSGNTSQFGGAATGTGSYLRCEFRGNFATSISGSLDFGGAVWGPVMLVQCLLEGNDASGPGGGAYGATLVQCTLRGNVACDGGGASQSTLDRCVVLGNEASTTGGGLESCSAQATIVAHNRAWLRGGGADSSVLERCTLFGNDASLGLDGCNGGSGTGQGGGVSASTVTNSILVQNTPDQVAIPGVGALFAVSQITSSDVEGGFAGAGNFDLDPLFWQPLANDFHLQPGSPCIDAGDPGLTDPDGSPLDVGALPFVRSWCPQADTFCTAKTSSQGCVPTIAAAGPLDGSQPFLVSASLVLNQKSGLFFYGLNGRATIPFFGGLLCARPPLRRTPIQDSGGNAGADDCSGQFAFDLGTWVANGTDPAIAAGTPIVGQFWFRDPADLQGIGVTDAVEVVPCH